MDRVCVWACVCTPLCSGMLAQTMRFSECDFVRMSAGADGKYSASLNYALER